MSPAAMAEIVQYKTQLLQSTAYSGALAEYQAAAKGIDFAATAQAIRNNPSSYHDLVVEQTKAQFGLSRDQVERFFHFEAVRKSIQGEMVSDAERLRAYEEALRLRLAREYFHALVHAGRYSEAAGFAEYGRIR